MKEYKFRNRRTYFCPLCKYYENEDCKLGNSPDREAWCAFYEGKVNDRKHK